MNDSAFVFAVGNRVLHLRSSSWMRLTPWLRQLRLLSGGRWRKSLAPPASASSVIISAGNPHRRGQTVALLRRGGWWYSSSLRLFAELLSLWPPDVPSFASNLWTIGSKRSVCWRSVRRRASSTARRWGKESGCSGEPLLCFVSKTQ